MQYINRPYTYLICSKGLYKIGSSMNPHRRLKQIQTSSPFAYLIGYTKKHSEKELHKKFKKWRVTGEWFNLPQYELENLCIIMHTPRPKNSREEIKRITLEEYIIPYGEFKGKLLSSMGSVDEIRYLRKQIRELPKYCEEWTMFTSWCNKCLVKDLK